MVGIATTKSQRVYEQLGAPVLLFRNVAGYTREDGAVTSVADGDNLSGAAIHAFQESTARASRAQARWYYHMESVATNNNDVQRAAEQTSATIASVEEEGEFSQFLEKRDLSRKRALDQIGVQCSEKSLGEIRKYDAPYAPAGDRAAKSASITGTAAARRGLLAEHYDRERRDRGDPDAMAPFDKQSIEQGIGPRGKNQSEVWKARVRQKSVLDQDNGPTRYGNCLVCFPCPCRACRPIPNRSTCLLHPVGVLLDHVRLSFLALPQGRSVAAVTSDKTKDVDVGDTVRQLEECGDHLFVVRTDIHCTVFSVEMEKADSEGSEDDQCCGRGRITQVHRIDLRSFSRSVPSFRPIDLACHPKYGRSFTKPNIAILTENEGTNPGERKTVHRVQCGQSVVATKHTFLNLLEISEIDFTTTHPMVLWAAARSHVCPALSTNEIYNVPRIGYGSSLFTLDLRSDQAVFQWSPSKECFITEGAHGISGIFTDWNKPHSVWIASTSAEKTWELDSRMPCSPVTSWTLPHATNQPGVVCPSTGLHGAGTLFSQPQSAEPLQNPPILTVDKTPGAFALHLLQRPETGPKFQTHSIECAAGPSLASLENASVAVTSTFALPDVSDNVFTCGLASFRAPTCSLLSVPDLVRLGFIEEELSGTLCAVTLTNTGDIYAHSMLESKASHKLGKSFPCLPVGASMITAPEVPQPPVSNGTATMQVRLSNEFPVPSSAYVSHALDSESEPLVLDLPLRKAEMIPPGRGNQTLKSVKGVPTLPTAGEEGDIRVPTELHTAAEVRLRESHLSFEPAAITTAKGTDADPSTWRSDVTPRLVQRASTTWNADDSDTDDSNDDDGVEDED